MSSFHIHTPSFQAHILTRPVQLTEVTQGIIAGRKVFWKDLFSSTKCAVASRFQHDTGRYNEAQFLEDSRPVEPVFPHVHDVDGKFEDVATEIRGYWIMGEGSLDKIERGRPDLDKSDRTRIANMDGAHLSPTTYVTCAWMLELA